MIVVALVALLLRAHHESVRDVLLGRVRLMREAALGIALIPVTFFVVVAVLALILTFAPGLHNVPRNPLEDLLEQSHRRGHLRGGRHGGGRRA